MRTIEFIADFPHADDGVTIVTYCAGETLEVSEACAAAAIRTGAGREPGKSQAGAKAGKAQTSSSSGQGQAPDAKPGGKASKSSGKAKAGETDKAPEPAASEAPASA